MVAPLLNADRLFQTLLLPLEDEGFTVAADLDVESIDEIPFLTHSATFQQRANYDGLWDVQLSLNLFTAPQEAFVRANAVHMAVSAWGDAPRAGVVEQLAGVETVEDGSALSRLVGDVWMENKYVTQYHGTYNLTVRNLSY